MTHRLMKKKAPSTLKLSQAAFLNLCERIEVLEREEGKRSRVRNFIDKQLEKHVNPLHIVSRDYADKPASVNERYCVIGDKAIASGAVNRTWFKNQKAAEYYAACLLKKQAPSYNARALCVVKVVTVVHNRAPTVAVTPSEQYDFPF